MEGVWYYEDPKGGGRTGPVQADVIEARIAQGELARETLVWQPDMESWAKIGSTTAFRHLFAATPPPLPLSSLREGAIYLMATLPIWSAIYEYAVAFWLSGDNDFKFELYYISIYWYIPSVIFNTLLGIRDERSNEKAGLKIKGAPALAFFIAPVYIFVRCETVRRTHSSGVLRSYLPFVVWLASIVGRLFWEAYRNA